MLINVKDAVLMGTLYKPANLTTYPVTVILHAANLGERKSKFYVHLREMLTSSGMGVFIYDRRGSGESTGTFKTCSFYDLADDALAAIAMLKKKEEIKAIGLYGISQGGWIASLVASRGKDVTFLIMVSTPAVSPAKQMIYAAACSLTEAGFSEKVIQEATSLREMVDRYFRGHLEKEDVQAALKKRLAEDWYAHAYLPLNATLPAKVTESKWYYELDFQPLDCFNTITVPSLFIFGEKDIYVPVQVSIKLFKETTKGKEATFLSYLDVDHFMNEDLNGISRMYQSDLIAWLSPLTI